jgi:hypothetical protein
MKVTFIRSQKEAYQLMPLFVAFISVIVMKLFDQLVTAYLSEPYGKQKK